MAEKLMTRTKVLCPNCMAVNVIQETKTTAYCDGCGQQYEKKIDSNSLKFI